MGDSDSSSSSSSDSESDSGTSGISGAKRWAGRKKRNGRKTSNGSKKDFDVEQGATEADDAIVSDADGATLKEYPTLESVLLTSPSVGTSGSAAGTSSGPETQGNKSKSGSTSSTGKNKKSNGTDTDVTIVHALGAGLGVEKKKTMFQLSALSKQAGAVMSSGLLEQHTPADAVLGKEGAAEVSLFLLLSLLSVVVITLGSLLPSSYKASILRLCLLELSHSKTFWKVRFHLKVISPSTYTHDKYRTDWRGNLR